MGDDNAEKCINFLGGCDFVLYRHKQLAGLKSLQNLSSPRDSVPLLRLPSAEALGYLIPSRRAGLGFTAANFLPLYAADSCFNQTANLPFAAMKKPA